MIVGKIVVTAVTTAEIAATTVGKIAATVVMIAATTVGIIATTAITTEITKKDSATGWTADRKITGIAESPTRIIPAIIEKEIPPTAMVFAKATRRVIRDTIEDEGGNR